MSLEFTLTKLIVADVEKLENFYQALGFKIVERRFGDKMTGSGDVAQEQSRPDGLGFRHPLMSGHSNPRRR